MAKSPDGADGAPGNPETPYDPSKKGDGEIVEKKNTPKETVKSEADASQDSKQSLTAKGHTSLEASPSGRILADGPLGDPLHIPWVRTRGMPLAPLAPPAVFYEEEWEKSFIRRNVTYVQGSVEFQSLIFATVLLEAALVVSSLIAGANDTFPETDKTIISEVVLYLLCLDFLMRVIGYGVKSFKQARFYFDGFIVAVALALTYLPVSAFDSLESTYGIKAASIAVSLRLGARLLRFALLLRILSKTAMDAVKKKPSASDLETEQRRLKQERKQRGKLETPNVKFTQIVSFAFGYLWKFERRNTIRMIVEIILIAGSSIAQPFLISLIFDEYIPAKDYAKCTYSVVGVVAVMLLKAQMNYRLGNDNPSGGDFIPLMTKNLTRKAVRLPWTIFSSMHGDFLVNALGTDMTDANANLDLMVNGFAAGLDLIAVLLTMTLFSWQMTLCIAFSLPLVVLYNKRKSAQVSLWAEKLNVTRKRSETHVQEIVHHVQHIKLLGVGPVMWRRLLQITNDLGEAFDTFDERKYGNIRGLAFLSMFTTLVTIAYGTVQVILGEITMGKLLGFLQLAQGIDSPIQALTVGLLGLTASRPAMAHIIGTYTPPQNPARLFLRFRHLRFELFNTSREGFRGNRLNIPNEYHCPIHPPDCLPCKRLTSISKILGLLEAEEDAPGKKPPSGGTLELNDVMYDYDYDDFSQAMGPYTFSLDSGVSLAIVGASGCGKSTMLKLIAGLFKPKTGSVLYDGVDLHEYDTTQLIAWMEQESILLTGSLRDNLLAGSKRAIAEGELMRACDLARFDWGKLAEGMDTYLGQNGSNLSAGDRQRIACARTILLRRPFIVCDEPTSAQDPATAGPVMASLLNAEFDPAPGRAAQKCSVLAVTHSISNAMRFDKVCVVSQGAVVEIGDTQRLLKLNGHFAQMVRNLTGITVLPSGIAMISAERLMDLWIFSRVRESQLLVEFTVIFISKQLRAGEDAAVAGTPADSSFIVARGALAVKDADGNILRTYEEGEMAGGINLHGKEVRTWGFSLTALRPTVVLCLQKYALEKELEKADPAVRDAVSETQAAMASACHPTSLRRIWAFATVPTSSLPSLVARLDVGFYSEKKRLFMHPKDPPSDAMVVVNGEVSVRYRHNEYGEYVQNIGARSCFAESSAFSKGDKETAFHGVAPRTNKGQSLTAITTTRTVVLIASRALLTAGGEHLQALAARAPKNKTLAKSEPKPLGKPATGWAAARTMTLKKSGAGIADAALFSMSRVEERALSAFAELEAHPRVFVSKLVADVKSAASSSFFKKDWLVGALPESLLQKIAKSVVVGPVEEGMILSGSYGWGSDAIAVVSGSVRVTYPGVDNSTPRQVTVRAGSVVNFEALLNEAGVYFGNDDNVVSDKEKVLLQPSNVEVVSGGCVVLRLTRRAFLSLVEEASREDTDDPGDVETEKASLKATTPSLTPSASQASLRKKASTASLGSKSGKPKLSPAISDALDTARGIANARDRLFTLEGTTRVVPLEINQAGNASTKIALAEALVESASVRCASPGETFENVSDGSDTTTSDAMTVSVVVLAGTVVVETLSTQPEQPASTAEGDDQENKPPEKKKEKVSGMFLTKKAGLKLDPEPEPVDTGPTVASTVPYAANDLFTLDSNKQRLKVSDNANTNSVVCLFRVVAGDGRLELVQRELTAARAAKQLETATRRRRQQLVKDVKNKTAEAEIALGLRKNRSARANWRVSLKKLRVFQSTCGDTENMVMSEGADSGACDLEEQLDMQNSILAEVAASLKPREERLRTLMERWCVESPVQVDPAMEPESGQEEVDPGGPFLGVGEGDANEFGGDLASPENGDLSASRLDSLEDLIFTREVSRLRRLKSYKVTCARLLTEKVIASAPALHQSLTSAMRVIDQSIKELNHATVIRKAKQNAYTAIPRKVIEDNPELLKMFGTRIDVKDVLAQREEVERASRARAAFSDSAKAVRSARLALQSDVFAKENALRAFYVELEVEQNSAEDDFRLDGGALHPSQFGQRTERRNDALTSALEKIERTAVLVRAAVFREKEDRRAELEAAEAAKAQALAETEARLRAEIARDLEAARLLAMRNKAMGSKNVAFNEKTWSTAPFARKVMEKFRVTLAVKRQFESIVDDIATEIASEAIPQAAREMRRELREAFKVEREFGYQSSDGLSSVASSSVADSSEFGDSRANSLDVDDFTGNNPSVNPYLDFDDDDAPSSEPFHVSPRTPVTAGATSIGARRVSSRKGGLRVEKPFGSPVSPAEISVTELIAESPSTDRNEEDDASTDYSVSDVSDVSTPSVTDSDEEDQAM